jgi:hypothetical protein
MEAVKGDLPAVRLVVVVVAVDLPALGTPPL